VSETMEEACRIEWIGCLINYINEGVHKVGWAKAPRGIHTTIEWGKGGKDSMGNRNRAPFMLGLCAGRREGLCGLPGAVAMH